MTIIAKQSWKASRPRSTSIRMKTSFGKIISGGVGMENGNETLKKYANRGCIGVRLCDDGSGFGHARFRCVCWQRSVGQPLSDFASQVSESARHRGSAGDAGSLHAELFRILRPRSEGARDRWTEPESRRLREVWLHRQWRLMHVPMRRARPSLPAKRSDPKCRRLKLMDCFAADSDDSSRSEPAVTMSDRSPRPEGRSEKPRVLDLIDCPS
jgi:hypothetical protein